jgi:SAM-dependent methyltransferase
MLIDHNPRLSPDGEWPNAIISDRAANLDSKCLPMRLQSDPDSEERVLTTNSGRDLLAEVAWVKRPTPADLSRWRRSHSVEDVSAALRLTDSRRRGVTKFVRSERMWFEPVGLEQATAEPVARHKAARFIGGLVFDICCGVGGDSLALAESARGVVAVDLDQGMTRRTRWNAEIYGVGHRVAPVVARAEDLAIPDECLVHVDPDRRAGTSARARKVDHYAPGLDFLTALTGRPRGGAIKLSPASDFESAFGCLPVEIELTSLGGECKEATVWFGELAEVRRRATCLPEAATWTDRDAPDVAPLAIPDGPLDWVFDPDPTLGRAGLLDGFASAHGLARVAPGCDFLTGPTRVDSPFLTAFEVDDTLPLDLKRLRRVVADRSLGPLEIKTRGLDLRPEDVRKILRPDGPNPATLLLVGGRGPSLAIVARRA